MRVFQRFPDITTYRSKISVFHRFLNQVSFETLARGSPGTEGMKVGVKKTSVPLFPDDENRMILRTFVFSWYWLVTDRWTDG